MDGLVLALDVYARGVLWKGTGMDIRALICGILALICILGAIIVAVMPQTTSSQGVIDACVFLASTFGGYVVGLYSSPTKPQHNGGSDNEA